MKKIFYSLVLALTVATSVFASGDSKARSGVVSHFKVQFRKASDLLWTTKTDLAKTELMMNNRKTEVFYDNGELVGSSTKITLNELPESVQEQVMEALLGYKVKEVVLFSGTDETAYYIAADNNKENIVLKLDENNNITATKSSKN